MYIIIYFDEIFYLKDVAQVTPTLLATDLCPDQTWVSDDPQQVSTNWNQNILEESFFSRRFIWQSDKMF